MSLVFLFYFRKHFLSFISHLTWSVQCLILSKWNIITNMNKVLNHCTVITKNNPLAHKTLPIMMKRLLLFSGKSFFQKCSLLNCTCEIGCINNHDQVLLDALSRKIWILSIKNLVAIKTIGIFAPSIYAKIMEFLWPNQCFRC